MKVLADGRVRRTEREWRAILARFERSGRSISAFCRREEISRNAFVQWRRRIEASKGSRPAPAFVEWIAPEPEAARTGEPAVEFELSLPGGAVLRWKA